RLQVGWASLELLARRGVGGARAGRRRKEGKKRSQRKSSDQGVFRAFNRLRRKDRVIMASVSTHGNQVKGPHLPLFSKQSLFFVQSQNCTSTDCQDYPRVSNWIWSLFYRKIGNHTL
ncbi:hypothetical protein LEMLEM_LOCUS26022, partial [Lemmus lemmus]